MEKTLRFGPRAADGFLCHSGKCIQYDLTNRIPYFFKDIGSQGELFEQFSLPLRYCVPFVHDD